MPCHTVTVLVCCLGCCMLSAYIETLLPSSLRYHQNPSAHVGRWCTITVAEAAKRGDTTLSVVHGLPGLCMFATRKPAAKTVACRPCKARAISSLFFRHDRQTQTQDTCGLLNAVLLCMLLLFNADAAGPAALGCAPRLAGLPLKGRWPPMG